jgi:hypothetical protein
MDGVINLLRASSDPSPGIADTGNRANWVRRLAEQVIERYPHSPKQTAPHAECTLLQYHKIHPETRPLNYMGVSKLACYACSLYFKGHARWDPVTSLSIRDTNGRVYTWRAPGDDGEEGIYVDMLEKIQRVLGRIVREFGWKLWESTVASDESGGDGLDDEQGMSGASIFSASRTLCSRQLLSLG